MERMERMDASALAQDSNAASEPLKRLMEPGVVVSVQPAQGGQPLMAAPQQEMQPQPMQPMATAPPPYDPQQPMATAPPPYAPQQPMATAPPPYAPQQREVFVNTALVHMSNVPTTATCPHCRQVSMSQVNYQMGTGGWAFCLGFTCLSSGVLCCVGFLPCCVESLQDAHHHCGRCGAHLGVKKFLF